MSTIEEHLLSGRVKMERLCESFPTLRDAPGASPWDQEKFARWFSGPAATHGSRLAAAFVLSVWNGDQPDDGGWWNDGKEFSVGRFDVVEALRIWDGAHQAAFLAWCKYPFYP